MTILSWTYLPYLTLLIGWLSGLYPDSLPVHAPEPVRVPLGGNSWLSYPPGSTATLSAEGLANWSGPAVTVDTYVRFEKAGTVAVAINLRVPAGVSTIRVSMLGVAKKLTVQGTTLTDYAVGKWVVPRAGYVKITLEGLSKTGPVYADVIDFGLSGDAVDAGTKFVRNNEGKFFYWGRRGPSVHLRYPIPEGVDAEWFYNEVIVPKGNDVIGSYYMADGFGEGYFGMQVNSKTERRILFSVWSPFKTNDPGSIPNDQKIVLEKKGPDVVTNDFGNEGSGGQSYLRYNWQAGQPYKFLLHGQPTADGYTTYTAYFQPPDATAWRLIARFKRPKTTTYLKSLYSFLENFIPEMGNIQREVEFSNQWVRSKEGRWHELTNAQFTADNTARKLYRMDYAGGLSSSQHFFLRNCGFFDAYTPIKTTFTRPAQKQIPDINTESLP